MGKWLVGFKLEHYGEKRNKKMKTHKNLYEQIITLENIHKAIDKAARGKKHRKSVQKVLQNRHYYAKSVQERLLGQKPLLEPTTRKIKHENGKDRELEIAPFYPNQIAHHAVANIIEPLLLKSLNTQSAACIKGRGVDYDLKRAKRYARIYTHYLQVDIRKFYANIDRELLLAQIARKIADKKALELLRTLLHSTQPKGLSLGSYLSAILGNFYLRELDYPACKGVKVLRYADDIVAFSNSKQALWQHFHTLQAKARTLGLELHKVKLKPIAQGLDFLGVKLYADFARVRARNAKKIKALAKIKRVGGKEFARIFSFYGFYQRACCFNLFSKVFRELKPKIKAYCKKSRIAYPLKGHCFYRREPRLFHF